MTSVSGSVHSREPSERPVPAPHRGWAVLVAAAVVALASCGGGPDASVGVTVVDRTVEVRAKPCGDGGIQRVDLLVATAPGDTVWSAEADGRPVRSVPVDEVVDGYRVTDDRPDGALPATRLRVRVQGSDGEPWGGPAFRPDDLEEGTLRVAGQDVPLAEWEAEPAQCPSFTLFDALLGGLVTAGVATGLWLVVRSLGGLVRRSRPEEIDPPSVGSGDGLRR